MEYTINLNTVLPVRSEPSEKAEMVTQLLFGEHSSVLDDRNNFLLIRNHFDGYKGWADKKMLTVIGKDEYENLSVKSVFRTHCLMSSVYSETDNTLYNLSIGSVLPNYNNKTCMFGIGKHKFYHKDGVGTCIATGKKDTDTLIKTALSLLNVPYLWGGKSIMGIDCSGFIQIVFTVNGFFLPRDASQQVSEGREIALNEIQPGDLVFFGKEGKTTHVGMYTGNSRLIHASGRVRIDTIDAKGIYNKETEEYTHFLTSIRRIF